MAIIDVDSNVLSYTGDSSKMSQKEVNGTNYDFYYGDVTLSVTGDFNTASVYCYNHGYMGGQNIFTYSSS